MVSVRESQDAKREIWTNLIGQRQQVVVKQNRGGGKRIILGKYTVINSAGLQDVICDTLNTVLAGIFASVANERQGCELELTYRSRVE